MHVRTHAAIQLVSSVVTQPLLYIANRSGLSGHACSISYLNYSLLSVSRGLSTLASVSILNTSLLWPYRLFPTRVALYILPTFGSFAMLINSHLPTLCYSYCTNKVSLICPATVEVVKRAVAKPIQVKTARNLHLWLVYWEVVQGWLCLPLHDIFPHE